MEWLNFIKGLEAWYCSILMTLFMISFRWVFKKKGRLQVQIEQDLSSNYISGIHLIKKSVEQFIRSVVA